MNKIIEAINDLKNGKMIILMDDEDRENEGDLVIPAETCTPEIINFMTKYGRGLICMPITNTLANNLQLNPMVENNTDNHNTQFTVSVDHIDTTTGISAYERSLTIKKLLTDKNPNNFRRPGHMFPLIAKEGLLKERDGHTEASIELSKLAGFGEAAVICEILKDDGTMARRDDLEAFSKTHDIKVITIKALKEYLGLNDLIYVDYANMPTENGDFIIHGFLNPNTHKEHIVLTKGDISKESVLCRIHSECFTGDVLGSKRCDCGDQLQEAMKRINQEENGIIIYLKQEGRGIGLHNKIKAYHLQDNGLDTVDANLQLGFKEELRTFEEAAYILKYFNVKSVNLLTNNPIKIDGLKKSNIKVSSSRIDVGHKKENEYYLKTKKNRMNHMINV